MLAAVTGMLFKPQEPNEPFGAMAIFADGRRSALPADFRGPLVDVLADMAVRSKHPVPRAILVILAAIALACVGGYFLLMKLIDVSRQEDCLLAGRRNCAPIEVPSNR